jgi:hypothetical protein
MFSVRRAEPDDSDAVEKLIEARGGAGKVFGGDSDISVIKRTEQSMLSVVAVANDCIVAFATFSQKCNQDTSELWLSGMGKGGPCCADSLWTTFFVADELYKTEAAEQILRATFISMPDIRFLLMIQPKSLPSFTPLSDIFVEIKLGVGHPRSQDTSVLMCKRNFYSPELIVREAKMEDHDDLEPILKNQIKNLERVYGEYSVANLVKNKTKENRTLVSEIDGTATGILAVTSNVDMSDLKEQFGLAEKDSPFKDVVKNVVVKIAEYPKERDPVYCLSERIERVKTTMQEQSKVFENESDDSVTWHHLSKFLLRNSKTWDLKSPWNVKSSLLVKELGDLIRYHVNASSFKSGEARGGNIGKISEEMLQVPELGLSVSRSSQISGTSSLGAADQDEIPKISTTTTREKDDQRVKWSVIHEILKTRSRQWCLWKQMRDDPETFVSKILKANDSVQGSLENLKRELGDLGSIVSDVLGLDREVDLRRRREQEEMDRARAVCFFFFFF